MLEPADDDDEEIRISKKALKDTPYLHVVIGWLVHRVDSRDSRRDAHLVYT